MRSKFMKSVTSLMLGACMLNPAVAGFNYPSARAAADKTVSGTDGEYAYELLNTENAGKADMEQTENGGFNCQWSSVKSASFKKGFVYKTPVSTDSIETLDFKYTSEFMPIGKASFGVKGSFSGEDADFCIVEAGCDWTVPEDAELHHTTTINSRKYSIYTSVKGGKTTYWSVCDKTVKASRLTYMENLLSFAEHLRAWELAGLGGTRLADVYAFVEGDNSSGTAFVKNFTVEDQYFIQEIAVPVKTEPPVQETTAATTTTIATTVAAATMTTVPVTTVTAVTEDMNQTGEINDISYKFYNKNNKGDVIHNFNPDEGRSIFSWANSEKTSALYGHMYEGDSGDAMSWDLNIDYKGTVSGEGSIYYGIAGEFIDGSMIEIIDGWRGNDPTFGMSLVETYEVKNKTYGLFVKEDADLELPDGGRTKGTLYRCVAANNDLYDNQTLDISGSIDIGAHLGKMLSNGYDPANLRSAYFTLQTEDSSGVLQLDKLRLSDKYEYYDLGSEGDVTDDPDDTDEELGLPLITSTAKNGIIYEEDEPFEDYFSIFNDSLQGKVGYEPYGDNGFKAAWSKTYDTIFSKGRKYDAKQYTLNDIDRFDVEYEGSMKSDSYSTCGIDAWLAPEGRDYTEIMIIDRYSKWKPTGDEKFGTFVSNGITYELYKSTYTDTGMNSPFITRYISVAVDGDMEVGKDNAVGNKIIFKDHIDAMAVMGLDADKYVSELNFYVDGFDSSGSATMDRIVIDEQLKAPSYPDFPMEAVKSENGDGIIMDLCDEDGNITYAENQGDYGMAGFEKTDRGFKAAWADGTYDVFLTGKRFTTETLLEDLNNLTVKYDVDFCDNKNATFGVKGWMKNGDSFYVMDGFSDWRPLEDAKPLDTIVVNGITYDIFKATTNTAGCFGTEPTHFIYYSIPKHSVVTTGKPEHVTHGISLEDHIRAWEKFGLENTAVKEVYFQVETAQSYGYAFLNNVLFDYEEPDPLTTPTVDDVVREHFDNGQYLMFKSKLGSSITYTDERSFSGDCSMRVKPAENGIASCYYPSAEGELESGKTYSFDFNILNTDEKNITANVYLEFDSKAGNPINTSLGTLIVKSGEWAGFSCPGITIPEYKGSSPRVVILTDSESSIYIDDFVIKKSGDDSALGSRLSYIPGDINGDGVVNTYDVILCRRELNKKLNFETYSTFADVNDDGIVAISDVIAISGFAIGKYPNMNGISSLNSMQAKQGIGSYGYDVFNDGNIGDVSYDFSPSGKLSVYWDGVRDCIANTTLNSSFTSAMYLPALYYNGTFNANDKGSAYYGAYGWFKDTLAEFYVIDGWRGKRPFEGVEPEAVVEIDGKLYDLYKEEKLQFSITGMMTDVERYFSIAHKNAAEGTGECRINGTIQLKDHVGVWKNVLGAKLKNDSLYSFGALIEATDGSTGMIEYESSQIVQQFA